MLTFLGGLVVGTIAATTAFMAKDKVKKGTKQDKQRMHGRKPKHKLDLSTLTIDKLKEIARKANIKGYYSMTKRELIEAIETIKKEVKDTAKEISKEIKEKK